MAPNPNSFKEVKQLSRKDILFSLATTNEKQTQLDHLDAFQRENATEAPEAFSGSKPVYQESRDEIIELIGKPIYDLMVEQLERPKWTPVPHPTVRKR